MKNRSKSLQTVHFLCLFVFFTFCFTLSTNAQRYMDKLDRGLVAVKSGSGVYLSWRIQADEYYDVTYNVYRDGDKIAEGLTTSNYKDVSGSVSNIYTIKAVHKGQEAEASKEASVFTNGYKEIKLAHEGIKSTLVPNDACCADVDGDGELEILMKFDNESEISQSYPKNGPVIDGVSTKEYSIFEVFKMNGTRLWWVNCGPNMGDFQNNEQNIVGYDWDMDGKAEVVMRLEEGSTIHYANGETYTIGADGKNGTTWTNYRAATGGGVNWFMHEGKEFLVYCNGQTGEIYQCITYPLARLESGETDLEKAWGDGYGHRSSKFFFGAPYLDGKKPSIFLARGIYTRHKMVAYDVDPATHQLTQRWKWYNNSNGPWKGQGYHNYGIADVDWDGRDEIVYGSMVIDDNGKGLSTTGLGHGDAQHCGDFNPYTWGQEIYACNEDNPGNNYRDATTSKIYHRFTSSNDDGRAMMDNFTDAFPGSIGCSAREGAISSVTYNAVDGMDATGINTNFRLYWDGDLVSETFNYLNGKNTEGCIAKYGSWTPIYTCAGSLTNNDTKGTPCYQGDIFGDWREELILRTADNNIRIYTTTTATSYRNYSLWYDHQYRNAMVWQMCGYNQPPHVSYFLGKLEGITLAPPPLTMTGRTEVTNGGSISSALNDKDVIFCETGNSSATIEAGASPAVLTFNVPTWIQGSASSECTTQNTKIIYTTYTCNVTGGGLSGEARLVKQGDGILNLPKADFTNTGATDIWGGVLNFDGKMSNSPLWLNRFAELNSNGGEFNSIKADYASVIRPGGADNKGSITTGSLSLGFGSRVIFDLYSDDISADQINIGDLTVEAKTTSVWTKAGPTYLSPVFEVAGHMASGETKMKAGKYVIGKVTGSVTGNLDDIVLEGLQGTKMSLYVDGTSLIIEIKDMRDAGSIRWTGAQSTSWDLAESENFSIGDPAEPTVFVSGDNVTFGDEASLKSVSVVGSVIPASFTVDNTAAYTIQGDGGIDGSAKFVKQGTGTVTMKNNNLYSGGNTLSGGVTSVSTLSNSLQETGNLGTVTGAGKFVIENGATLKTTAAVTNGSPISFKSTDGGIIENSSDFKQEAAFSGTLLTKKGSGTLYLNAANASLTTLNITSGSVAIAESNQPKNIRISGTGINIWDDGTNTTHGIDVAKDYTANWNISTIYYTAYANKLTGEGTITIIPRNAVSRVRITGDWSNFHGTIKHTTKTIWLPLDMNASASHATLDITNGCSVANVPGRTLTIGAVTGSGTLVNAGCDFKSSSAVTGTSTWSIGNSDDNDFTFAGTINDNSSTNTSAFNKVGTCTMTFTGTGDYSGATNINAGTLILNNANKQQLGTGALTVKSGATLAGVSTFGNKSVTIAAGGTLRPGITETSRNGTMTFAQNVTINGTYQAYVYSKTSFPKMTGIKKLSLNGTLKLRVKDGASIPEGTTIQLWDAESTVIGDNLTFDLQAPGDNLMWDTSDIANGNLTVVADPTGINSVNATEEAEDIYNVSGVRENKTQTGKVYIVNGKKVIR